MWADNGQDIHVVGTHDATTALQAVNDYERRAADGYPWYLFDDRRFVVINGHPMPRTEGGLYVPDTVPDDLEQQSAPAPEPAPAPSPPSAEPEPTGPMAAPELTIPPKPERSESAITRRAAHLFEHLIWMAVVAGLLGQIVGWTSVFGHTLAGYVIAVTLGGVLELIMVSASSRGLRDIGSGQHWIWSAVFLAIGTAAAGVAVVMIAMHFAGPIPHLGLSGHDAASISVAAIACCVVGYVSHVAVHLPTEIGNRKVLQAWQKEADRVQAEIDDRARRRLAARDDLERRQLESAAPAPPKRAPESDSASATAKKTKPRKPAKAKKPDQDTLFAIGRRAKPAGPADWIRAIEAEGWTAPSRAHLSQLLNHDDRADWR